MRGGGRHGQLVTGRSISMDLPALTPLKHHNQPQFGSVGAESPRERRSGCVLWRAFFLNYGQRGDFKASLNCDQADEFYPSAQLLASKTWQSISVRRGVSSDGRGKAQWLSVQEGKLTIFVVGGGWWDCLHFSTGRSKSNNPPSCNCGKHDNQT